ncbi:MAG: sulfotransferase family protein [Solirubrobacteraceae bacterium]
MKLIGAGLPRTGTLSQKIALEMLGLAPCYHMVNVLADLDETARWGRVLDGDLSSAEIFEGYGATVDWPGSFFYRELAALYPDAKVLLSLRSGESWARSMRDTIWGVIYGDILIRHLSDARRLVDSPWDDYISLMSEMWRRSGLMHDADTSADEMALAMERFNREVQDTVPAERLLVWSVADGWEPLCEFLELPVPEADFPRVNDSAQFGDRIIDGAIEAVQRHRHAGVAVAEAR